MRFETDREAEAWRGKRHPRHGFHSGPFGATTSVEKLFLQSRATRFPEYAHDYGVPDYQFVIPCLLFKYRTVSPSPDAEIPRRCVEFVISLPPFSLSFFPFPRTPAKRQLLRLLLLLSGQSALLGFLFFIFCGESNLLQKASKTNRPKKKKEWKFSLNSVPLLEGERNFYDAPTFSTIQPPPRI